MSSKILVNNKNKQRTFQKKKKIKCKQRKNKFDLVVSIQNITVYYFVLYVHYIFEQFPFLNS